MKEMTHRTKVHTREELLHRIVNVAAYIQDHPEVIQHGESTCLERARLRIEKRGGHFEQI
jgi:hypothetical protein